MAAFDGKTAVVTGAASGIGLEVAKAFAEEGATVCGVDIDAEAMSSAAHACRGVRGNLRAYNADVSAESEVTACVRSILRDVEKVDVLVNNAGINMAKPIDALTTADWDRVVNTNLRSVYLFCKQFWDQFVAQRSGVIVNMSSIMGQVGGVNAPAYCATKSAVCMWTRCLAKDGARHGIRVNAICPGYIDTPILDAALSEHPDPESARRAIIDRQPLGRLGVPKDVANGVLFLASEKASFVSGISLTIDGAVTATQID